MSPYLFDLNSLQILFSVLIFIWSGFVRSGLGFGGAALGLPIMLMIDDQPLFWLPVIGWHLIIFTGLTLWKRMGNVDWNALKQNSPFIFPAKLAGVFGLLNLPNDLLIIIIYCITLFYAVLWLLKITIHSENGWSDKILLVLGGYVSGTSLTGAPLMVAVFMNQVNKHQLRDTLFVLWFILVTIKMSAFATFGFDLHIVSSLLLLPGAAVGHVVGLRAHQFILRNDDIFKRVIGLVLMIICILALSSNLQLF